MPRIFRPNTRIIEVNPFSLAEARAYHAGELAAARAGKLVRIGRTIVAGNPRR